MPIALILSFPEGIMYPSCGVDDNELFPKEEEGGVGNQTDYSNQLNDIEVVWFGLVALVDMCI